MFQNTKRLLERLVSFGVSERCDEDEAIIRRVLMSAWIGVSLMTPVWGATYVLYGETAAGLIPITYAALSFVSFGFLWRFGGWHWIRISQLTAHLILPFPLMWILGGFVTGSAVLIWALLAPLSSLWGGRFREANIVIAGFIGLTVLSGLLEPYLRDSNNLPQWLQTGFFVGNFVAMSTVIFLLVDYLVRKKNMTIAVMRRNRELERAYLQQEVTLRQSDKLATLGKLSAGLAHELNNPTAAAQQSTRQLKALLTGSQTVEAETSSLGLLPDEAQAFEAHATRIGGRVEQPEFLDSIERSDREDEILDYLDAAGVDEAWDVAPSIVGLGLTRSDVESLAGQLRHDQFRAAITMLAIRYKRESLLGSLAESTARIVELVKALKSYTYLDQGPRQLVDVHEGLDSTLLMFQSRLKTSVEVSRSYAKNLPEIEAYGGELNQVWTNILDNALDAMGGAGVIAIKTGLENNRIIVEITDNGPGIPDDMAGNIFDPFVTTKPPGEGTGLGLNVSHNIIVQKHGGEISVSSKPGSTTFRVILPVNGVLDDADRSGSPRSPLTGPSTEEA